MAETLNVFLLLALPIEALKLPNVPMTDPCISTVSSSSLVRKMTFLGALSFIQLEEWLAKSPAGRRCAPAGRTFRFLVSLRPLRVRSYR